MEHRPSPKLGLLFGLGMILALASLDAGLVVLALTSPITPLTVLRTSLVLLSLPVMGLFLYGMLGLNSARYTLDRNVLVIRWGKTVQVIPLPKVDGILRGTDLGRVSRFRGLRWPGHWTGRGQIGGVGLVQFYCTTPLESQVIIKTRAGSFAISPENPDRFMDQFATQRRMGPSEGATVEQTFTQPQILHRGFFSDRAGRLLLALGGILNLALFVLLTMNFNRLPRTIPLHFDLVAQAVFRPDRIGASSQLFSLAALGTAAWLLNGILGTVIYRRWGERMAACLLWGAAAGLQVLLCAAIIGLITG